MTDKVAIIGCGLIGRAWAVSFARGGHRVALWDPQPEAVAKALPWFEVAIRDLAEQGLLSGQDPVEVRGRIGAAPTLADALAGAAFMQESAPEQLAVKQALFSEMDALAAPETVLASSTSALLCSSFTEHLAGRARCIVAHPANPPYLMPVVEISGAPWTAPEVAERTRAVMAGIGQTPVLVRKEIYGFVLNRLQVALLHEAFRLLADGVCTPADIDATIKEGLALRWSFMGPLETMDLNAPGGIGDYINRYEGLAQEVGRTQNGTVSWAELRNVVVDARSEALPRDQIQARQEWRDRRLMALAVHKADAAERFGD